jgi:hypothetical protein
MLFFQVIVLPRNYLLRNCYLQRLAQLIESIGHVGKIGNFTIKPLQQHSFLLTSFSRHTSYQPPSSGTTVSAIHDDATRTRLQRSREIDSEAVASLGTEGVSSDDDGGLSDRL